MKTATNNLAGIYSGKRVLITGHTGFKGSWLTLWLSHLGATTFGYALAPPTNPSLFELLRLADIIDHQVADIRDESNLTKAVARAKPDIIFHLAAQSLVRESYDTPFETVEINTLGTIRLMEAVRRLGQPVSMVMVTSDKCYENKEWLHAYRETDPLGGHDPYSASKAGAELFISSWRKSFFHPDAISSHGIRLASARAGNVVGGGDWTKDNLVPDCIRALQVQKTIEVRNPLATRPWQHVIEALGGYLLLGAKLLEASPAAAAQYCDAFNFGPRVDSNRNVRELVEKVISDWGNGSWRDVSDKRSPHEASLLSISIDKAYHVLGWQPKLSFDETIYQTVDWYRTLHERSADLREVTLKQIKAYENHQNKTLRDAALPPVFH